MCIIHHFRKLRDFNKYVAWRTQWWDYPGGYICGVTSQGVAAPMQAKWFKLDLVVGDACDCESAEFVSSCEQRGENTIHKKVTFFM